jgi:hypothetical protein
VQQQQVKHKADMDLNAAIVKLQQANSRLAQAQIQLEQALVRRITLIDMRHLLIVCS